MRSLSYILLICSLFALVSLVAATSPSEEGLYDILNRRKDEATAEETGSESQASKTASPEPSETKEDSKSSVTDASATEESSESGSKKATKTKKQTKTKTTSIDPRLGAGGVQMITPGVFDGSTYVKIGDYATFKWNYTSVQVTPTAVDVVAYCSRNDHYYTIEGNMSVEETGVVTWDTSKHASETVPLLTETYSLMIYDTEQGPSGRPKAGHLGMSNPYRFGAYYKRDYTPLSKYQCATCNSAMSPADRQALYFMFGMVGVTIASFTWFASGLGLLA